MSTREKTCPQRYIQCGEFLSNKYLNKINNSGTRLLQDNKYTQEGSDE